MWIRFELHSYLVLSLVSTQVIDNSRKWWKARNMHGQAAHVPHTIVTLLFHDEDVFSTPSANDWGRKGKKGDLRYF